MKSSCLCVNVFQVSPSSFILYLCLLLIILDNGTQFYSSALNCDKPWHKINLDHDTEQLSHDFPIKFDTSCVADWPHLRKKRTLQPRTYNPFHKNASDNFVHLENKNFSLKTDSIYNAVNTPVHSIEDVSNKKLQPVLWDVRDDSVTVRRKQGQLMKQYMDPKIDPCVDFYQYACGNWGKLNPIPKDKAAFDTFELLRESLDVELRELLEEHVRPDDNESYVKAKNLYKSCVNHDLLKSRGNKPLLDLLDQFGGWPIIKPNWDSKKFDWQTMMGQLRLFNNDVFLSEWVGPDIKNSSEYIIQLDQTGLGLPTRDYYILPSNRIYLEAYRKYLIATVTMLGAPLANATKEADEIIKFEIDLARITSPPDDRKNVSELYRRMPLGQLQFTIPHIDWFKYLSIILGRSVAANEEVVIYALRYCQDLVYLMKKTPHRVIANYLLWRFVRHRVNNLDDSFQEAKQKFYFILYGREETPSRWKTCISQVNNNMGMAIGAMFVRKYFDENSKSDTLVMTKEIKQSFLELLAATYWIDPETKSMAAEKADEMMLRIGYPDFILNSVELDKWYKNVSIHPDMYFENILNFLNHLTRSEQAQLGTIVNKTIWNTAPAVVNAYYSRNKNQIMFPAGILQPPFYHRHFPRGLNYGGIGVVIGHEITHGFDDKGRLFDKYGNLHRWWKYPAIYNFHEKAKCLIEQYGKYTVSEVNLPLDGVNTQGENIADNGGIKQAFKAYKRWLSNTDPSKETLPGFNATGMELFFLNFAQIWCGNTRPETTRNKLKTAVHAPGKFRVIGTLQNSLDFASVYNCPLGSPMNPYKKCSVW